MAGRPEQNGLFLEESAGLAVFEDALNDETCLVTSRTETSCGYAAEVRSVQRFLVKRSLARPMTPLAAARIVCVDR